MGFEIFSRKRELKDRGYAEMKFWALYTDSLYFKDHAAMKCAQRSCEECMDYIMDKGYEGMGYHNLAILNMYHIGNGVAAANCARKSLEFGNDFYQCSLKNKTRFHADAYLQSLQIAMMTAHSYKEALEYSKWGEELYGDVFIAKSKEIENFRCEHPRFFDYQRQIVSQYCNCSCDQSDQNDYAPAMSLLQLMLIRAKEPSFNLSYEECVDVLEDYGTFTGMYMAKEKQIQQGTADQFARELAFIAYGALDRIADFLPNCLPKDRDRIDRIVTSLGAFSGVQRSIHFTKCRQL